MAIVARASRGVVALALSAVMAACSPAPSAAPGGSAATATEGAAASGPPSCPPVAVETPAASPRTWADRIFYEVFVRSFADSDGDGIGDLAGLTSKLDYLNDGNPATTADLGVTGIWLMPVAEAASYHGYDVTDYTAVEHDYGDRATLKAFVDAAHARGIEVIVDFVINHTSSQHPWFRDALAGGPHHDWYIWSDSDPHWPAVAGGNPWHLASNGTWYYGAFWEGMPDLNLRNPEVTAEIDRVARLWLDDLGVDGFRIDAAKHLIEDDAQHQINTPETKAWLADFTRFVHTDRPDALVVGEVWDSGPIAGSYVPGSVDLTFDFGLAASVGTALQIGDASPIETALRETVTSWPPNQAASFLTNHDQVRIMSALGGDQAAAKLAAFILLAAPGVPFLYYGEEIGMTGRKPDEQIRTPMPWSAETPAAGFSTAQPWELLGDGWQAANVATEAGDPTSLLSTYRADIALRAADPALRNGATTVVAGGAHPVIAWLRALPGETLLALVNVDSKPVGDYSLALGSGPLCGTVAATIVASVGGDANATVAAPSITSAGGFDAYKPMPQLAPRSGYLLRLQGPT